MPETKHDFDCVVHLAGDQILPNFVAIRQFSAPLHLVCVTGRTESQVARLQQVLGASVDVCSVRVEPYRIPESVEAIDAAISKVAAGRIGFNMTGGTKPMFAAAFSVCNKIKGFPFYVNTENQSVDLLMSPFSSRPLLPAFDSCEQFILLSGFPVSQKGMWTDEMESRKSVASAILKGGGLGALTNHVPQITKKGKNEFHFKRGPFALDTQMDGKLRLVMHNQKMLLPLTPGTSSFLKGHWLEEAAYLVIRDRVPNNSVVDLRIGLQPEWQGMDSTLGPIQDLDVAFTDGFRLFIAECKSHKPVQVEIQKLENIVRTFGGTYGVGAFMFPAGGNLLALERRLSISSNLCAFCGPKTIPAFGNPKTWQIGRLYQ